MKKVILNFWITFGKLGHILESSGDHFNSKPVCLFTFSGPGTGFGRGRGGGLSGGRMVVVLVLRAQKVVQDVDDGGDVPLWLAVPVLQGRVQGS